MGRGTLSGVLKAASQAPSALDIERGTYLTDARDLYRVIDTTTGGWVLLEDCHTLDPEWWETKDILRKLTLVRRT